MIFLKRRSFGDLISDTFMFFKEYGKNFFANYLKICGPLILLLMIVFFFFYRNVFQQLIDGNVEGNSYFFQRYFEENMGVFITGGILTGIVMLLLFAAMLLFPIFYMRRVSILGERQVRADDLIKDMKQNIGRFFIYILVLIFVVAPGIVILMGISGFLMFVIIGFFLLLFLIPVIINVTNFMIFDYFHRKVGIFNALGYAIRSQFSYQRDRYPSPFWKYWGTMIITALIVNILTSVFTLLPGMLLGVSSVLTLQDTMQEGGDPANPFNGPMGYLLFIFYAISMVVSFIASNINSVNAGLMYYDSRIDLQQNRDAAEINTIGGL